jgi:hypothetical protein
MATFELWMFHGGFDTFALDVVTYTIKNGNHVILLLTSLKFMKFQQAMVVQLTNFLACYELLDKIIACVKLKGKIKNTLAIALTNIMPHVLFLHCHNHIVPISMGTCDVKNLLICY